MNAKRIWLVIPAASAIYLLLFSLVLIFFSPEIPYIMEHVFNNNALILLLVVLLYGLVAACTTMICFILALIKKWDALSMAKTVMIVKIVQFPAYAITLVLAVIFLITIFTWPLSILMGFCAYFSLMMTGFLQSAAVILAIREKKVRFRNSFWVILLQFIYCANLVASIIFYVKLRNITKKHVNLL